MNITTFHAKAIERLNDYMNKNFPPTKEIWHDKELMNIHQTWSRTDSEGWNFKFIAFWFLGNDNEPHHDVHVKASKKGERKTRNAWLEKDEEGHYRVV